MIEGVVAAAMGPRHREQPPRCLPKTRYEEWIEEMTAADPPYPTLLLFAPPPVGKLTAASPPAPSIDDGGDVDEAVTVAMVRLACNSECA